MTYPLTNRTLKHLESLDPKAQAPFKQYIEACNRWADLPTTKHKYARFYGGDFSIGITDSRRDIYEQAGKYSQGRKWDKDRKVWTKVGDTVTNTLHSKHVLGLAIDRAPFAGGRIPFWPNPNDKDPELAKLAKEFWGELAFLARQEGLIAGTYWESPDHPHVEYP